MSTLTDGLFVTPKSLLCVTEQYNKFMKAFQCILEYEGLEAVMQSLEVE